MTPAQHETIRWLLIAVSIVALGVRVADACVEETRIKQNVDIVRYNTMESCVKVTRAPMRCRSMLRVSHMKAIDLMLIMAEPQAAAEPTTPTDVQEAEQ